MCSTQKPEIKEPEEQPKPKRAVKKKKDDYDLPEIPDYERPELEKYEKSDFDPTKNQRVSSRRVKMECSFPKKNFFQCTQT